MLDRYLPNAIRKISREIPEEISRLYERYPYEKYGEPYIRKKLRWCGIRDTRLEYQECVDAALLAYLYSIHRCAYCGYEYVEYYIRKMISISIVWGMVLANEDKYLCQENQLRQVRLDALERKDRW